MKILIVQLRRVGDILLTTPVIRYLASACPGAQIDFLCEPMGRPVLERHPLLRRLRLYDKNDPWGEIRRIRAERYDAVLDFMGNPRTRLLTLLSGARWRAGFRRGLRSVFYNIRAPGSPAPEYVPMGKMRLARAWLRRAGLPSPEPTALRPELHLAPEDEDFAADWAAQEGVGNGAFFVAAPAHRHPVRAWRSAGFRSAIDRLQKSRNWPGFLAWGPGEEKVAEETRAGVQPAIRLLPPTHLRQMAAIFRRARLVLTNDSGAMHLAVAVGTPTVTIYGPTRPADWNPSLAGVGPRDAVVTADGVPCLGCHLNACPVGHLCMEQVDANRVVEACEYVLKENR